MPNRANAPPVSFAVVIIGVGIVCLAVGWLSAFYDLQVFRYVAGPIFVWLVTARDTREYFRFPWFWWTSALFIVVSTIVVERLHLLPHGIGLLRWAVVIFGEAAVFLAAVMLQSPRAPQASNRNQ